ncbi:MAG: magnesium transporter [Actinobacteria bacterium]|nr:magnesium transporter [Actinomycetota bacterium]
MFLARDVAEESVVRVASHRLPWLVINLGTAAAAATVIGAFQGTIEAFVALTVFLPVIGGMGGNAGTQTLAVLVRMLAMGRVSRRGRLRVLWDELSIGLIKGLIIGFLIGVVAGIWQQSVGFGVVVGGAMLGNMLAAGLVGTAVPMVLQRLRLDPAIGSGVLVTVATDVIGFTLLLGLATLLLNGLR